MRDSKICDFLFSSFCCDCQSVCQSASQYSGCGCDSQYSSYCLGLGLNFNPHFLLFLWCGCVYECCFEPFPEAVEVFVSDLS
jgi:hypothetical protein